MKKTLIGLAWVAASLPLLAFADSTTLLSADEVDTGPHPATPADRGFLFTADPTLAAPAQVIVSAGMGNVTRSGEERPAGAANIVPTVGVEVGVVPRLSIAVDSGIIFWSAGTANVSPMTVEVGPRILLTNPADRNLFLTVQPTYGLDFFGNSTILLNLAFAWNYDILRVAASAIVSHTFQPGADPADVTASIAATIRIPMGFRVGVEGVVTDLEEIATAGDEGGSSAFAGPTLGWEWGRRFQIVGGPAYGFGPNYTGFLGRVAASVLF